MKMAVARPSNQQKQTLVVHLASNWYGAAADGTDGAAFLDFSVL